jgi:hypothetical protein
MHPFDEALNPVFLDRWCVVCSSHGELYCHAGGFVTLCPNCAPRLIGNATERVPLGLAILEIEAHRSARGSERREQRPPTVDFDVFVRCHVCTRLIESRHARYPSGPRGKCIPAHCVACYEARRG